MARLGRLLTRIKAASGTRRWTKVSPFAVPVMLEIGREPVPAARPTGSHPAEASADDLIAEALS